MSIFDIFSPKPIATPAAVQPAPGTPGTLPNGETSTLEQGGTPSKGTQPANSQPASGTQPANAEAASPLDAFKDLWQPDPNAEKNGTAGNSGKPFINIDPAKIRDSVKRLDFSRAIDPALAQKALAGDVGAFSQVVSGVAQAAVSSAMAANLQVMSSAFDRHEGRIFDRLPSELKKHTVADSSASENLNTAHPAVRPLFESVQQQFINKHPDASSAEIKRMTTEYLSNAFRAMVPEDKSVGKDKPGSMTSSMNGTPGERLAAIQAQGNQDWSEFFGEM